MNVGEGTSDTVEIGIQSGTTITVPAGETWKFTTIGMTEGGSGGTHLQGNNASLRVGFDDGTTKGVIAVSNSNGTPTIGGVPKDNGQATRSMIVDGDNTDLWIYNGNSNGARVVLWCAVRIS